MNTYSKKITNEDAEKIKKIFESKGAVFDTVQYSHWRAKKADFQAIYYTSGKILIQGKEISNIVNELFDKEQESNVISQLNYGDETIFPGSLSKNNDCADIRVCEYIGTDESGKGDFFGPLVVAGVKATEYNKQKFIDSGIKDSKKLEDKKILQLANLIKAESIHSVVVIMPLKYNELYLKFNNLNKLLAWGHARVIENILEKSPCDYALADKFGDESLIKNALMSKGRTITLKQMVRAEADIAVAAASVLARAEFVKRMQELENKYELPLSKGASSNVVRQAQEFIKKYSFERLNEIAKLHFKTVYQLTKNYPNKI